MKRRLLRPAKLRLLLGVMDGGSLEARVRRLIDARLPWSRLWRVVAAAACAAVMAALCVGGSMMAVRAQERATKFDVVSIKPNKSGSMGLHKWGPNQTGYSTSNAPLVGVILQAYLTSPNAELGLPSDRVKGAPTWVTGESYDITAKADEATIATMKGMTDAQRLALEQPMLQAMLAERCKLVAHIVPTEVQGYALVVGKHGIKMKETPPGEPLPAGVMSFGGTWKVLIFRGADGKASGVKYAQISMAELAMYSLNGRTPIVDQTGLTSKYDFDLPLMDTGSPGDAAQGPRPDIAHMYDWDAVGLEMKPIKVSVPMVVIDHIERPTEN